MPKGATVYAIFAGSRRLATAKRVAAVGQPVTATVTKTKQIDIRGVGKTVTVEYAYNDPFGRSRKGRGPFMYPSEGAKYRVGARSASSSIRTAPETASYPRG